MYTGVEYLCNDIKFNNYKTRQDSASFIIFPAFPLKMLSETLVHLTVPKIVLNCVIIRQFLFRKIIIKRLYV